MNEVIVDTNFLIYSFDNKWNLRDMIVDLLGDSRILYTQGTLSELKKLGRDDIISWLSSQGFELAEVETKGRVDDSLINLSSRRKAFLLTEDRKMIEKALSRGVKIISKGWKNRLKIVSKA